MSLDKSINSGKEHRKPYYRAGKHDRTCRPGGTCPYCQGNREHGAKVREQSANYAMADSLMGIFGFTREECTPGD